MIHIIYILIILYIILITPIIIQICEIENTIELIVCLFLIIPIQFIIYPFKQFFKSNIFDIIKLLYLIYFTKIFYNIEKTKIEQLLINFDKNDNSFKNKIYKKFLMKISTINNIDYNQYF